MQQSFHILTWNLQYEGQRKEIRQANAKGGLSLEQRIRVIADELKRYANEKTSIFCLQEVDQAMLTELEQNLEGWELRAPKAGLLSKNLHCSVVVYRARDFSLVAQQDVVEDYRREEQIRRWACIVRLSHMSTGIVCDVMSAHLRGMNLLTLEGQEQGCQQLDLYHNRLLSFREHVSPCAQLAFQALGMDSNRRLTNREMGQRLEKAGFEIERCDARPASSCNPHIGDVCIDAVAIAPLQRAGRVNQLWIRLQPSFILPRRVDDLRAPTDHHPSLTRVDVLREHEQELELALEHLGRLAAAPTEHKQEFKAHLGYLKQRALVKPLQHLLIARASGGELTLEERNCAGILGFPELRAWQPPADDYDRKEQLLALLLGAKGSSALRMELILEAGLGAAACLQGVVTLLVRCLKKGWPEPWPLKRLLDLTRSQLTVAKQQEGKQLCELLRLLIPRLDSTAQLDYLELLCGLKHSTREDAMLSALAWTEHLRQEHNKPRILDALIHVQCLARRISSSLLHDSAYEILRRFSGDTKSLAKRHALVRCVLKPDCPLDSDLHAELERLVHELAASGEYQAASWLFDQLHPRPLRAAGIRCLEQLIATPKIKLHALANLWRPTVLELCALGVDGAQRALRLMQQLAAQGYTFGAGADAPCFEALLERFVPEQLASAASCLELLPNQCSSKRLLAATESGMQQCIQLLCTAGRPGQARQLLETKLPHLHPSSAALWTLWLRAASSVDLTERLSLLPNSREPKALLMDWLDNGEAFSSTELMQVLRKHPALVKRVKQHLAERKSAERCQLETELVQAEASCLEFSAADWEELFTRLHTQGQLSHFIISGGQLPRHKPALRGLRTYLLSLDPARCDQAQELAESFEQHWLRRSTRKIKEQSLPALLKRFPSLSLWERTQELPQPPIDSDLTCQLLRSIDSEMIQQEPVRVLKLLLSPDAVFVFVQAPAEQQRVWALIRQAQHWHLMQGCVELYPDLMQSLDACECLNLAESVLERYPEYEELSQHFGYLFTPLCARIFSLWQDYSREQQENIFANLLGIALQTFHEGDPSAFRPLMAKSACLIDWVNDAESCTSYASILMVAGMPLPHEIAHFGADAAAVILNPRKLLSLNAVGLANFLNMTIDLCRTWKQMYKVLLSLLKHSWMHNTDKNLSKHHAAWLNAFLGLHSQSPEHAKNVYRFMIQDLAQRIQGIKSFGLEGPLLAFQYLTKLGYRCLEDLEEELGEQHQDVVMAFKQFLKPRK